MKKLIDKYLRSWDGPLTSELVLNPAGYGLGKVPEKYKPDRTLNSVCGFCATGCSLRIHIKNNEAVNLSPNELYPVNKGMACPKGWEALSPLYSDDRAVTPLIKKDGALVPTNWDDAATTFLEEVEKAHKKHGPESMAFLSTGQIATEEMAFLGALTKFGLGFIHGDGNTRQCMATAATAYKQSFGFDAPPYSYKDFELSDVLVFVGANPCIAHPIMWQRVMENKNNPTIIVVDPRKTETAVAATEHLQILPKSDLILFYYVAKLLIQNNWVDTEYIAKNTNGYTEFKEHLETISEEQACSDTGLSKDTILSLATAIHEGKKVSFWWTMGVNQSYEGTRVAQSIINLALLTGNIGKPGTGANSITGQCNAMGSRLFSNTTNLLGGHNFTNIEDRQKVAELLEIDVERIPDQNSKSYYEIIDDIEAGKIKFLWVIATNTAHSWINQNKFKRIREKLDFLVVQDMYHTTETAQIADLVLPAAGWGEKDGTFINSERRIGLIQKVSKAPGEALSDFNIFRLLAGYANLQFFKDWDTPEHVFQILKKLSVGQPCNFSGIKDYAMIDEKGGVQWPYLPEEDLGDNERRLFADGKFYHNDHKAKLLFSDISPKPETISVQYPFMLLTGRGTSSQWHTQTRTAKSEILKKMYPEEIYCEINPEDANALGVQPESIIEIQSVRGKIQARAAVTSIVSKGQVFIPMHYAITNQLTMDAFDPYSKQPSYKYAVVAINKVFKN